MIKINAYSLVDLIPLAITIHLIFVVIYRYLRVEKRISDLLFACALICAASYCLMMFLWDNVVIMGELAVEVPGAAERSLLLSRGQHMIGTVGMAICVHFAIMHPSEIPKVLGASPSDVPHRYAWLLYAAAALLCFLQQTDWYLKMPQAPIAETSSWEFAIPWSPSPGPLSPIFPVLWICAFAFAVWRLWPRKQLSPVVSRSWFQTWGVWLGILLWGLSGLVDFVTWYFGYQGVALSTPVLAFSMLVLALGLSEASALAARERKLIKRRFEMYVDPSLVKFVLDHPTQTHFDGENRVMSAFFADLEGFTRLSELAGEGIVGMLSRFRALMVPAVRRHNGFICDLPGDGIMCLFGAPLPNPDHARDAVRAALAMENEMTVFNQKQMNQGWPAMRLRVGISTGEMVVGDAGPEEASKYSAIGVKVNLASRLEQANKRLGSRVLLDEETAARVEDWCLLRPVGRIPLSGLRSPVATFEAICQAKHATDLQRYIAQATTDMVQAFYRADFEESLAALESLESAAGVDRLSQLYRNRLQELNQSGAPWDFNGAI